MNVKEEKIEFTGEIAEAYGGGKFRVLLENGQDWGLAAARAHGYRLREIATHLGVHESTVSRRLRKKGA